MRPFVSEALDTAIKVDFHILLHIVPAPHITSQKHPVPESHIRFPITSPAGASRQSNHHAYINPRFLPLPAVSYVRVRQSPSDLVRMVRVSRDLPRCFPGYPEFLCSSRVLHLPALTLFPSSDAPGRKPPCGNICPWTLDPTAFQVNSLVIP